MSLTDIKNIIYEEQKQYNLSDDQKEKYTDSQFDSLLDYYEEKTGETLNLIGMKPSDRVVILPYPMPSISKPSSKDNIIYLNKFISNYPGEKVIEDKMDGISILLVYSNSELKIYGRGDGFEGQDISYISNYISLPKINEDLVVRGELILDKKDFLYIQETMKNDKNKMRKARTLVSGAINRKDDVDTILPYCKFYSFEILNELLSPLDHIRKLKEYGFLTVNYNIVNEVNYEILENILKERRINANYEIDGLIVIPNIEFPYPTDNINPKNKFAFKINTVVVSKVTNIEWRLTSRYGVITPVIHIEPINILQSDVSQFSAHNAKYVIDNKLGIDAIIGVTLAGDIIPQLANVIIPSENYPSVPVHYHWNESNIEIIVNDLNHPQIKIQEIHSFLNHLNIKSCGIKTIEKIYYNTNIKTINDFLKLIPEQISMLDGLGIKSANNICDEIKKGVKNFTYSKLMAATGIFGEGLSEERFDLFIDTFPQWMYSDISQEMIQNINGMGPILSTKIANNLYEFKEWLFNHPEFYHMISKVDANITKDLEGEIIVFSGMRDEDFKRILEQRGAKVKSSFVNGTTILIVKDLNENSSKITKAKGLGIRIIERKNFK